MHLGPLLIPGGRALESNLVPQGLNATIQKSRPSTAFGEKVKALSSRPTTLVAISMFEMLLPTLTAIAQTTTATVNASSAGGSEMAEMVVTARETSERLQDIPMSLTVLTARSRQEERTAR